VRPDLSQGGKVLGAWFRSQVNRWAAHLSSPTIAATA
jgi:hypothetical protein